MTSNELFSIAPLAWIDYMEAAFYRAHGMLAPGKDYPAACNIYPPREMRLARFRAWKECMGPSDYAAILSLGILHTARESQGCDVCGPGPCVPWAHGMGPDWT